MNVFYERMTLASVPNPAILTPSILRRAKIGEKFWDASLAKIPDRFPYKDVVAGYIAEMHKHADSGWGLVLSGPFGTGKTALGSIILKEGLMRRGRCLAIRTSAMIDGLWSKKAFLPNGAPLLTGLLNVNFLFLDDFEHYQHAGKNAAVEEIIRGRYDKNLPTIISTNHSWDQLLKADEYLQDLLEDRWWGVAVNGISWRKRKATPPTTP